MDIRFDGKKAVLGKKLNALDNFVIDFTELLGRLEIKYVLISGYVSILFGRSRSSEDVDIFIEEIDRPKFKALYEALSSEFECINADNMESAYENYLRKNTAIRFSRKNEVIPNMEVKFPKTNLDIWALENREEVELNGKTLYISPIELQIAYKLYLGSGKDIEDAKYLYTLFKDKLNKAVFNAFISRLKVKEKLGYLRI